MAIPALQRPYHEGCAGDLRQPNAGRTRNLHTEAFHTSLAFIDYLTLLVPRIALHDPKLAQALRTSATAIPVHVATGQPERLQRAYMAAHRVYVMLTVIETWAYVPADDLAARPRTRPTSSPGSPPRRSRCPPGAAPAALLRSCRPPRASRPYASIIAGAPDTHPYMGQRMSTGPDTGRPDSRLQVGPLADVLLHAKNYKPRSGYG
jgi:hypothetical protein